MPDSEIHGRLQDLSVRKIALLIANVDSATAQQLMLQLPCQVASEVRSLLPNLRGDASECAEIMAEIQKHANHTKSCLSPGGNLAKSPQPQGESGHRSDFPGEQICVESILQIVTQERPEIAAVIISQLPPQKSIEALQRLGRDLSSRLVHTISQLAEIEPELRAEIANHVSEKMAEEEVRLQSQNEADRKLESLLNFASPELRKEWSATITAAHQASQNRTPQDQANEIQLKSSTAQDAASEPGACPTADEKTLQDPTSTLAQKSQNGPNASEAGQPLSSPATEASETEAVNEHDFESLLLLSTKQLRALFDPIDSETVLLALAGASPDFLKGLESHLDASKIAALEVARKQLGPIKIRDIDESQSRLLGRAAQMTAHNKQRRAA